MEHTQHDDIEVRQIAFFGKIGISSRDSWGKPDEGLLSAFLCFGRVDHIELSMSQQASPADGSETDVR